MRSSTLPSAAACLAVIMVGFVWNDNMHLTSERPALMSILTSLFGRGLNQVFSHNTCCSYWW
ncbi:hypothetical protein BD410DRAFT_789758 [Rickenella mellea]|uniref:Uncharacterized protein n=1 Tax=Rickenella mellea TaxID=50990 RepID=A0A4Y7Q387_9AGAM|nr:hypothetical protein BD410DRAFT_789758 [Rickenella mellea]